MFIPRSACANLAYQNEGSEMTTSWSR